MVPLHTHSKTERHSSWKSWSSVNTFYGFWLAIFSKWRTGLTMRSWGQLPLCFYGTVKILEHFCEKPNNSVCDSYTTALSLEFYVQLYAMSDFVTLMTERWLNVCENRLLKGIFRERKETG
jgi:hypothetical protein